MEVRKMKNTAFQNQTLYFAETYSGVTKDELEDLSARIKYYKK
jgi:hypothetical protein